MLGDLIDQFILCLRFFTGYLASCSRHQKERANLYAADGQAIGNERHVDVIYDLTYFLTCTTGTLAA